MNPKKELLDTNEFVYEANDTIDPSDDKQHRIK